MSNLASLLERPCRANKLQCHCRAKITWEDLECALTDRFHPKESQQVHVSALQAKLRRPDEDLHQLRCEIARLVELAYPDDQLIILDCTTSRDFFIGALTPLTLREKVLDLGPNTLDEALAAAQWYESKQSVKQRVLTSFLQCPKRWTGILLHVRGLQNPPYGLSSSFNNRQKF